MFRSAVLRAARPSSSRSHVTSRPVITAFVRHKATLSEEQARKKQILEKRDDLQRDWDAPKVTYEQVKPKTLSPSPTAYLIDVREPDEVVQGSIPSAVNLPLSVLSGSLHLPPREFEEKFGFEKPGRNSEIVFYCRSGKRSASASDIAKRNGFTNIYNYEGSWLDWVQQEGTKGEA